MRFIPTARPTALAAVLAALLPLSLHAAEHKHDEHGHSKHASHENSSLDSHEHGHGKLNLALDGNTLELELHSPAFNLIGFEHAPRTAEQHTAIEQAKAALSQPLALFGIPETAGCRVDEQHIESALFSAKHDHDDHDDHDDSEHAAETETHNDIAAHYRLTCSQPAALETLRFGLFEQFAQLSKLDVQHLSEHGQSGASLSAKQPTLHLH